VEEEEEEEEEERRQESTIALTPRIPSPRPTFRAPIVHNPQLFPAEIVLVGSWAKKTRRTWLEFICNERCYH
jgi:hypothetical protein